MAHLKQSSTALYHLVERLNSTGNLPSLASTNLASLASLILALLLLVVIGTIWSEYLGERIVSRGIPSEKELAKTCMGSNSFVTKHGHMNSHWAGPNDLSRKYTRSHVGCVVRTSMVVGEGLSLPEEAVLIG
jgi:hypothetical protein